MSNFLAIATVTETLRQMLSASVSVAVSGANATAVRPTMAATSTTGGEPKPTVNVFLYQVNPNAAWRNTDLPTRRDDGSLASRPLVALDLHYLLTFYGQDTLFEPQRLLGCTVKTLHSHPVLNRKEIRSVVHHVTELADSDLADQVELVKFTPVPLTLEELSKLWSIFFQTAYVLSVAYQGTVVLIESDESPRQPPPVRERRLRVLPFHPPVIDEVSPQVLESDGTLTILGRHLKADVVEVRFGSVTAAPKTITDGQITVALPQGLPAGVNTAQVVQLTDFEADGRFDPHRLFESNATAFMIAPRIDPPLGSEPVFGNVARNADFLLQVTPPVGRTQDVWLLLGHRTILLPPRPSTDPPTTASLKFKIPRDFPTGEFLVRVQVDGAQSTLIPDAVLGYTGPKVVITCAGKCLRCRGINLNPTAEGMEGLVTVQDETSTVMMAADVSAMWTLPDGTTQNDVRRTDSAGVAAFHCTGGRGEYVLTIRDIAKKTFEFDQRESILRESQSR